MKTGRYFIALTLREAETIRRLLQLTRGESLLHRYLPGNDTAVALRLVDIGNRAEESLVDFSYSFPDCPDQQLQQAFTTLRFLDSQTYYGNEDFSWLVKALQNNSPFERLLFTEQSLRNRRRPRVTLSETTLGQAISAESEFKLLRTIALSILLDIAMEKGAMAINEVFMMFDARESQSLRAAEMFCALEWLGMEPTYEQIHHWMRMADKDGNLELSLNEFSDFIRNYRMGNSPDLEFVPPSPAMRPVAPGSRKMVPLSEEELWGQEARQTRQRRIKEVEEKIAEAIAAERQRERDSTHATQHRVKTEQSKLIVKYLEEEEELYGPNPDANNVFNLQRSNLPRCIQFHGPLEFLPEMRSPFIGKQHFALDPQAHFFVRPFPSLDGASLINSYSITWYMKIVPSMSFSMFQVVTDEGEEFPLVRISKGQVRVASPSTLAVAVDKHHNLMDSLWSLVTIVVNLALGEFHVYCNGVPHYTLFDAEKFAFDGPWAIHPEKGVLMFPPDSERKGSDRDIGLRAFCVHLTALTEEEVIAFQSGSQFNFWKCCELMPPDQLDCAVCGKSRGRGYFIDQEENPSSDPNDENYGVTLLSKHNIHDLFVTVLEQREAEFALLLCSYHVTAQETERIQATWRWLAAQMFDTEAPLIIGMLNSDEVLEDEHKSLFSPEVVKESVPVIFFYRSLKEFAVLPCSPVPDRYAIQRFIQDNMQRHNFAVYSCASFHRYWRRKRLGKRFKALRRWWITWMNSAQAMAGHPLRALAMQLLSDGNVFTEAQNDSSVAISPDLLTISQQGRFDDATTLREMIDQAVFATDNSLTDAETRWATLYHLDAFLTRAVVELARHYPDQSDKFVQELLSNEPVVCSVVSPVVLPVGALPRVKVANADKMMHSEIVASWPTVVKATARRGRSTSASVLGGLIAKGFPVNVAPYGHTALHLASAHGNLEAAAFLFANGANLHAKSRQGYTAIEIAAAIGQRAVVEFLIESGSFFGAALHCAAATGQSSVIQTLLSYGVDVHLRIRVAPLEVATLHENLPAVRTLLAHGAEAHAQCSTELRNRYGLPATATVVDLAHHLKYIALARHLSTEEQRFGMSKNIIDHIRECLDTGRPVELLPGMNVNAADVHGWTPLTMAALADDETLTTALIEAGAVPHIQDSNGLSAILWADLCGSKNFKAAIAGSKFGKRGSECSTIDAIAIARVNSQREMASNSKNETILSLLDTSRFKEVAFRISRIMWGNKSSLENRQQDYVLASRSTFRPPDTGEEEQVISVEAFLRLLAEQGGFPGGVWGADIEGFIASCKLFLQHILAKGDETPLEDMLCLHVYTRSDSTFFARLNEAIRENSPDTLQTWRPFLRPFLRALEGLDRRPGLCFRGVRSLFQKIDKKLFLPEQTVSFSALTSCSENYRVAANFMYGGETEEPPEGSVVFKIWGKTPISIKQYSFFPEEDELIFLPNSVFQVMNWYEATDTNIRRGARQSKGPTDWLINCNDIVQVAPLDILTKQATLDKYLTDHRVVVIELKEVPQLEHDWS
eukprot:c18167_g1_i1.p1 GENE.c18167_g1_i1~~c18167_g1_i1.p1  ORF type:complete len:1528 (+),score=356.13 c18167_g1_i1:224-4807(+)